ncbi:MAG: hypothetical protein SNJ59_08770 [Aggregatilineales bacterium]
MGQGRAVVYNLISLLFLLLSIAVIALVILQLLRPAPQRPRAAVVVPTAAELPTETPTFTPTATPIPTETLTPTPTLTPTETPVPTETPPPPTFPPTNTPIPTDTPPPTVTPIPPTITPSLTITNTLVPTVTPVPTDTPALEPTLDFTPQPTVPPPSPFPFDVRENQVIFTSNFANAAGCAWQGIGGQVFDINGQPLSQIRVHVFGSGVDAFAVSGSNTLYGPSGWEIPVSNFINTNTYIVELQSATGTIISPQVQVTFTSDCTRNLALVNFQQNRPF